MTSRKPRVSSTVKPADSAIVAAAAGLSGGFFASSQMQVPAELQPVRRGQKVRRADEMIFQKGKLAFGEVGKTREKPLADKPAQNGIAQKFQAFIIGAVGRGEGIRKRIDSG